MQRNLCGRFDWESGRDWSYIASKTKAKTDDKCLDLCGSDMEQCRRLALDL